jgi:hypothetical protein
MIDSVGLFELGCIIDFLNDLKHNEHYKTALLEFKSMIAISILRVRHAYGCGRYSKVRPITASGK